MFRPIKFLPKRSTHLPLRLKPGNPTIEKYIHVTKCNLDEHLPNMYKVNKTNLTKKQQQSLTKLKKSKTQITIKPADKNLGIVLMNTDDYILQCATHLSDTNTYRQADRYPEQDIVTQIGNIIANFKPQIKGYNEQLYKYLLPNSKHTRIPQFYGIPKIHKTFTSLPPIRPIVSQTESPLTHTAQLIDHVLQPLAQTYPDYLHNSTSLVIKLQDRHLHQDCILVTIDVESLYPSIPQTECLTILYTEMHKHRQLMLFDPNLIIQLLQTNVNYNYFQFADLTFQQIHGTAMGAAFSPTVANIYMSVILRNFLNTQQQQPLAWVVKLKGPKPTTRQLSSLISMKTCG